MFFLFLLSFSAFASSATSFSHSTLPNYPQAVRDSHPTAQTSQSSDGKDFPQPGLGDRPSSEIIPLQTGSVELYRRISVEGISDLGAAPSGQPPLTAGGSVIQLGIGFNGLSQQTSANSAVPDVQIAAGPTNIFEMVNTEGRIWTGQGILIDTFSLSTFFGTGGDTITQPKLLYDNESSTWFASVLDESANDIVLASSVNSDPVESWNLFKISAGSNCPENPAMAVDSSDLVITANDYSSLGCLSTSGNYVGAQYWIIQKSSLTTGSTARLQYSTPDPNETGIFPVDSLTTSSALYMVSDGIGNGTSTLSLFTVAGVVPSATVQVANYSVATITEPPEAVQEGTSVKLDTGDARVQDAVWSEGSLWLALNEACTPAGDTQIRSCIRLVDISTVANSVVQDFGYGEVGYYYYYPALSIDSSGDLGLVFGYSSSTAYPSIGVTAHTFTDPANTLRTLVTLKAGSYPDYGGLYGNYFAAAIDPTNPDNFWVAGEFYPNSDWSTFVGSFKVTAAYSATFSETGLPQGAVWAIVFNTTEYNSNSNEIVVANLTLGTYAWSVTASVINGSTGVRYLATQTSGSLDVVADTTQTIGFTTQYEVSVVPNQTALGSTTPTNSSWYSSGAIVSISAEPTSPNFFAFWAASTSALSIADPLAANTTATVGGPGSIIANFAPIIVSLSPVAGVVSQGSSISIDALVRGPSEFGTLSINGIPSNVNYSSSSSELSINPAGDLVNFTLSPSYSTTPGSFQLTFLATANGSSSLPAAYDLTVRAVVILNISYVIQGGGSGFTSPTLNYFYNGTAENATLPPTPLTVVVDQNSAWSVSSVLNGSNSEERFATNSTNNTEIASSTTSATFVYFHQYLVSFSYNVAGGGFSYSAPVVNTTQFGEAVELPLKTSVWVDSGASWSVPNPLPGSSGSERWATESATSGTIESPTSISLEYFRQFYTTIAYVVIGGSESSPEINYTSFGVQSTATANSSVWMDWGGSYVFPSILSGSNPLIRAVSTNPGELSGKIFSASSILIPYQNQFYLGLASYPTGSGSESPASGWYSSGSNVIIAATNHSGWAIDDWQGSGTGSYSGSNPSFSATLNSPMNETADYSPLYFVSVTKGGSVSYSYGASSGTIPANSSQDVYVPLGSQLNLHAAPSSILYVFKGWTGSTTKSSSLISVSATSPVAIEADFAYNYLLIGGVAVIVVVALVLLIFRRRIFR